MSGAVPPPTARPLWRAAGVPRPVCSGLPSVRALGPSTGCSTACALAGRRCSLWGWRKGVPGGAAFHHCEGRQVSGAVYPPAARPLERAAGVPRRVCPGCGRWGRGDPAPAPERAPLRAGVARCGGGGRASPGGGAFHHCEGRLRSGAVPPPTARPLGGLLGSATHVLWARVCGCGGPTLSPWPACPAGAACRGAGWGPSPGGVACHRCGGRLVSGAAPPPAARPLERAARVPRPVCPGCGRCGRGDPAPSHSVRPCGPALLAVGPAEGGVPGGAACHPCEGRLRSGAVPPPTARPLGGLLGSATHVLWARVCGCGGPTLSPWPACPVGAACRGGRGGPSPGGVACQRCEGRLVSGAVPPPAARPLERAARVPRPVRPGCGRCGRGDPGPAPQRAPLRAGVARRGGGSRASPGLLPSAVVRGVWGQTLPLPRLPALRAAAGAR